MCNDKRKLRLHNNVSMHFKSIVSAAAIRLRVCCSFRTISFAKTKKSLCRTRVQRERLLNVRWKKNHEVTIRRIFPQVSICFLNVCFNKIQSSSSCDDQSDFVLFPRIRLKEWKEIHFQLLNVTLFCLYYFWYFIHLRRVIMFHHLNRKLSAV